MIVGIDPGKTGALAFVDQDGLLAAVIDMPVVDKVVSAALVAQAIRTWGPSSAAVELVHSMPGQGVASSFGFGRSYGVVLGVLGALDLPVVHVAPTVWKRGYHLGADKEKARRLAIDLWPKDAGLFARVKDDGRAEAALIALWAVRQPWLRRDAHLPDDVIDWVLGGDA